MTGQRRCTSYFTGIRCMKQEDHEDHHAATNLAWRRDLENVWRPEWLRRRTAKDLTGKVGE